MIAPREIFKITLLVLALSFAAVHIAYNVYTYQISNSLRLSEYSIFGALPISIIGIWVAANISKANFLSKPKTKLFFKIVTAFALVFHIFVSSVQFNWRIESIEDVFAFGSPFTILGDVMIAVCLLAFIIWPSLEESAQKSETFS